MDLISRAAAIDALVKAIRNDPYYDSNERINGLGVCDVRVIINDLQSAQPEIIRCRDCLMHGVCRFEKAFGLDGYCSQAERG